MKSVSLEVFYGLLEKHDWFWVFSDDPSSYRWGQIAEAELLGIAEISSPDHVKMLHAYHDHVWSGDAWNTPKMPKPAKPGQS